MRFHQFCFYVLSSLLNFKVPWEENLLRQCVSPNLQPSLPSKCKHGTYSSHTINTHTHTLPPLVMENLEGRQGLIFKNSIQQKFEVSSASKWEQSLLSQSQVWIWELLPRSEPLWAGAQEIPRQMRWFVPKGGCGSMWNCSALMSQWKVKPSP